MFIPAPDAARSDEECWQFLAAQGFGHLIAPGVSREFPVVVPTQYVVQDGSIVLHLARPNPVWGALAEHPVAVLSVAGDWAYIPAGGRRSATKTRRGHSHDVLRGKFKYGGNVDAEHRAAIAHRLGERSGPGDAAARAQLLRRRQGTVAAE